MVSAGPTPKREEGLCTMFCCLNDSQFQLRDTQVAIVPLLGGLAT